MTAQLLSIPHDIAVRSYADRRTGDLIVGGYVQTEQGLKYRTVRTTMEEFLRQKDDTQYAVKKWIKTHHPDLRIVGEIIIPDRYQSGESLVLLSRPVTASLARQRMPNSVFNLTGTDRGTGFVRNPCTDFKMQADRYLKINVWLRRRYTVDGSLTTHEGGIPTRYKILEAAFHNRIFRPHAHKAWHIWAALKG